MGKKSNIKNICSNFLTMAISIFTALILGEIVLRILLPQQEASKWFISNEKYGYLNRKNFYQKFHYIRSDFIMDVKINSIGHRFKEYDTAAFCKPDIQKILLIGDSFTFGYGINMEDYFGVILENLLNKSDNRFMIINAGVGGWGTLQATLYAKDNFAVFNPEIIIYTFCGNDPDDDIMFTKKLSNNDKGVFYFPFKIWLRDHSHLFRFLLNRSHILFDNFRRRKKNSVQSDPNSSIDIQSVNLISEDDWNRSLKYIEKFHKDFLKFNPRGLLLIQATAPWNTNIRDHLRQICNSKNLVYIDLYDETITLSDNQRYLPYDRHWSKQLHQISANKLYNFIQNKNLSQSAENLK